MAEIIPVAENISDDGSVQKVTWSTLTTTNITGTPVQLSKFGDKTVSVTGVLGVGGTLKIQGSNDNTNWFDLTDPQGNALSFTALGMEAITENPMYIMPKVSAGNGTTNFDVIMIARLSNTLRT